MPVYKIVEDFFLLCLDAVSGRFDFTDGTIGNFLIPTVQFPLSLPLCDILLEDASYLTY